MREIMQEHNHHNNKQLNDLISSKRKIRIFSKYTNCKMIPNIPTQMLTKLCNIRYAILRYGNSRCGLGSVLFNMCCVVCYVW